MSQAETSRSLSSAEETAFFVLGGAILIVTLWIAAFLIVFTGIAFAQSRAAKSMTPRIALPGSSAGEPAPSRFEPLPPLDAIDAQTDITIFLRGDVPAGLRRAALRRAWTMDTAIRDFRGLQENDWNFDRLASIPGFGELGPEVDVEQMVARILGGPARMTVASSTPR
jgi:hypothetical protein